MNRRTVLKGVVAAGMCGLFGGTLPTPGATTRSARSVPGFTEIGRSLDETTHVAPGYDVQVLIRWGDPIHTSGPPFRPGQQTAAEQEVQFGMDNDFIAFMPLPHASRTSDRGLLCVNHERNTAHLSWPKMSPGNYASRMTRERCEVEMASQGHTVIEIARAGNAWHLVADSRYNRRITCRSTAIRISGPAAGHERLKTRVDPAGMRVMGTLNNCAGGVTPWGTVLTAEENFHLYFIGKSKQEREAAAWKRYGIDGRGIYLWGRYFERFNLDREPNEPNRFGWIVEIDPYDPQSTPVKRTALGRCKHECATTAVSHDGRVAVYSGDDERMEYVYKFVTRGQYDPSRPAANRELLDEGTLYVAKFEENGKMRWLPLVFGEGPLTAANGFRSQADVAIEARRAADLLGATPMDRPEDVEANPLTGHIYVVMTYNDGRKADQLNVANPRAPNYCGHIIEIAPPTVDGKPDHTATECTWGFFLLGGDPVNPKHHARYRASVTPNGWLCRPDNVAFDPKGRIWIATDGQDDSVGFADSVYAAETSGERRGITRCFFSAPRGAEICGPAFTPDGTTLFLAIQHPGDEKGSTFDQPSTRWPDFKDGMPPRPSVIAITKADGGEIGS
ncbi:MAG: PhoX family phosphatase [Betaproteobacteria bacterium]|nr:PhoX family phosphatase [Betaproteobacteria bacterium]